MSRDYSCFLIGRLGPEYDEYKRTGEWPMTASGTSGQGDVTASEPKHPAIANILQYFEYEHLPEKLQEVSKDFADLARKIANRSSSPETTVALRKLLESKDAAVRAAL